MSSCGNVPVDNDDLFGSNFSQSITQRSHVDNFVFKLTFAKYPIKASAETVYL